MVRRALVLVLALGFPLVAAERATDAAIPPRLEVWRPSGPVPLASGVRVVATEDAWDLMRDQPGWTEVPLGVAPFDLAGWRDLLVELDNPGTEEQAFDVLLRSAPGSWDTGAAAGFRLRVPAGFSGQARLPIEHLRFSGSGWSWPTPWAPLVASSWGRVDSGLVREVIAIPRQAGMIRLRRLALDGPIPAVRWVDAYGQRATGSWPGKVASDADLARAEVEETAWLAAQPALPERDEYQAWSAGPRLEPRRFFNLEQVGGRWWLVAPSGHVYIATGLNVVHDGTHAPLRSPAVRDAYRWLPPREGPFLDAWRGDEVSLQVANLRRLWGDGWRERHRARAIERMRAWGFTGIGNWSDEALVGAARMPWVNLGPNRWWPTVAEMAVPEVSPLIHDVFHPRFAEESRRIAANGCARFAEDPYLIGHFVFNEVGWNRFATGLLAAPEDLPARAAFIDRLLARHGTAAAVAAAWGVPDAGLAALRWPWKEEAAVPAAAAEDMAAFRGEFAERWYAGWAAAIRAADPNHLLLGSRFQADERYPEVVSACGRHCEVLSVNQYQQLPDPVELRRLHESTGRPILIGEYGHYSLDYGLLTTAVPVATLRERGLGYRRYTEALVALPFALGGHCFQYGDEPITGRFDTETAYNGFVAVTGIPWPDLRDAARATQARIYAVASGAAAPFTDE